MEKVVNIAVNAGPDLYDVIMSKAVSAMNFGPGNIVKSTLMSVCRIKASALAT